MGKDNHPRERQKQKLERKKSQRAPYPRILIVSEGTKTEPLYFREIQQFHKLHSANICILPSGYGTSPNRIVEYAHDIFMNGDPHQKIGKKAFDRVYAVFDRDEHDTCHNALQTAQAINTKLGKSVEFRAIASVPCFELWLLLHFEDIQSPLHRDEAFNRLKAHLPNYDKGQHGLFEATRDTLDEATQRANRLAGLYNEYDGVNPFTSIHELVGFLNKLKLHT